MLPLLAVALGQTVVLITGGIDLSVTSVIAAASVAAACVMTSATGDGHRIPRPEAVPLAVAVALGVGLAAGALNGAAVAALALPPFIVTLGNMMLLGGATLWATHSNNIAPPCQTVSPTSASARWPASPTPFGPSPAWRSPYTCFWAERS